ncbi:FAD:protein FMN transferase [Mesonia maritima]|uniref:FAD:protein FMN transferase n=1 Tax=Mesonia maritima TaxID=1793873 RepID=A0ABU1K6M3_9FLAO|nr:FAD:protein FMN transferase [Mesonia maritima]MDR6301267.1 thiamine biosynthesis lipoprotein [Mesonia maritima]
MKKIIFTLFLTALIFSCTEDKSEVTTVSGNALGTTFHIKYFSTIDFDVETKVDSVFEAVNKSMSTYLANSDISKINKGDSTIQVDHMFREVFQLSKKINKKTKGYFDPTVGNLVNFYGFGADKISLPTEKTHDSLMNYVGLEKINLTENNYIKKENPQIYLEFNAIGKGYAVDRLSKMFENEKVKNYLVEVGGEIRASGKNLENEQLWRVGIDDPQQDETERSIAKIVSLNNTALATSGNYRKFRIDSVTGQRFVHTINPKTGFSEKSDILSASVLAKTCAEADGYATAFMAMGSEKSILLVEKLPEIEAYFIYDDNGNLKTFTSTGFEKNLLEK